MKKRSTAIPYEGESPFIFVCYCHKDRSYVYPVIEYLTREGYRIWYDEGITPGSEWNEVIAGHMNKSNMCIAFISENSVNSHNCRREISFALLKNKPLLSVFLEKTVLTPGMEMQLSANQCINAYTYSDMENFLQIIKETLILKPCLGQPNPEILVRRPSYYREDDGEMCQIKTSVDVSDEWFGTQNEIEKPKPDLSRVLDKIGNSPKESQCPPLTETSTFAESLEFSNTDSVCEIQTLNCLWDNDSLRPPTVEYILTRQSTGEVIALGTDILYLGRDVESSKKSYIISGNKEISREHCYITSKNNAYFITDNKSKNKTYLNGMALKQNEPVKLKNKDSISLSSECFVFLEKPLGSEQK